MKITEQLRLDMNGCSYMNNRGQIVKVIQIVPKGRGHSVIFNYNAAYNVVVGLGQFTKRYPRKVEK